MRSCSIDSQLHLLGFSVSNRRWCSSTVTPEDHDIPSAVSSKESTSTLFRSIPNIIYQTGSRGCIHQVGGIRVFYHLLELPPTHSPWANRGCATVASLSLLRLSSFLTTSTVLICISNFPPNKSTAMSPVFGIFRSCACCKCIWMLHFRNLNTKLDQRDEGHHLASQSCTSEIPTLHHHLEGYRQALSWSTAGGTLFR